MGWVGIGKGADAVEEVGVELGGGGIGVLVGGENEGNHVPVGLDAALVGDRAEHPYGGELVGGLVVEERLDLAAAGSARADWLFEDVHGGACHDGGVARGGVFGLDGEHGETTLEVGSGGQSLRGIVGRGADETGDDEEIAGGVAPAGTDRAGSPEVKCVVAVLEAAGAVGFGDEERLRVRHRHAVGRGGEKRRHLQTYVRKRLRIREAKLGLSFQARQREEQYDGGGTHGSRHSRKGRCAS